jgi:hypothetical protein
MLKNECKGQFKRNMTIFDKIFHDNIVKQKFKKLEDYFENINENDLLTQELSEYIEWAEPKHKPLMSLLVRDHLNPFIETMGGNVYALPLISFFVDDKFLGSKRIASIKELIDLKCPVETVRTIDLSDNNLCSDDLQHILNFVQNLDTNGKLENTTILLNNNRIHGIFGSEHKVRTLLNKLVLIESVQYVDLRGNPFCSKEFFMQLPDNRLLDARSDVPVPEIILKLIWIERWDVFSVEWTQSIVKSDEVAINIRQVHMRYYEPQNVLVSCANQVVLVSPNMESIEFEESKCCFCGKEIESDGHQSKDHLYCYLVMKDLKMRKIRDWKTGKIYGFK